MRRFSAPFSAFFSLFCTKALFPAPFIEVHEHGSELYAEILIAFHIRTLPQMGNAYLRQIHCSAVLLSLSCQVCILAVKEVSLVKAAYTFKYVSPYADKAARAEAAVHRLSHILPPHGVFVTPSFERVAEFLQPAANHVLHAGGELGGELLRAVLINKLGHRHDNIVMALKIVNKLPHCVIGEKDIGVYYKMVL